MTRISGIGIVCCITLLGLWCLSLISHVSIGDANGISLTRGALNVVWFDRFKERAMGRQVESDGFRLQVDRPMISHRWWANYGLVFPSSHDWKMPGIRCGAFVLPLWLPFLLIATPTAIALYSSRRRLRPGHCPNCNYNLTGNLSGVCPECGATTPAARNQAHNAPPTSGGGP